MFWTWVDSLNNMSMHPLLTMCGLLILVLCSKGNPSAVPYNFVTYGGTGKKADISGTRYVPYHLAHGPLVGSGHGRMPRAPCAE